MATRPDPCWQQHLTEALERRGRVWGQDNPQRLDEAVPPGLREMRGIVRDADDERPARRLIPFMRAGEC